MSATTSAGTYRAALRVREFDAIAASGFVSVLGDSAAFLAATILVYQRTGSALLSALTFAVAFVPYLFGGTLLAALVDRLAPKSLLIAFDLTGAGLIALAAIPGVPLVALFAALFIIGALAPVRMGAASALVAHVLPGDTFVAGRSLQRIASQLGQLGGTALGGALVAAFGPHGALLADTGSFLLSAAISAGLVQSRPALGRVGPQSLVADSVSGMRAVWAHRDVRRLLLLGWIVPFIAVAPEGLGAPAVAQTGHSPSLVGLWLAAIPVGTVLGDVLVVWLVPPRLRRGLTWPLALTLTALMTAFATGPSLGVSLTVLVLAGAASSYGLGLDQTLRDTIPAALLARMLTLNTTGLMVVQGLGFAAAGATAQVLPAHQAIAAAGAVGLLAVSMLAWRAPGRGKL